MIPRYFPAIAAVVVALGGAIALPHSRTFLSGAIAQNPIAQKLVQQKGDRENSWLMGLNLSTEQVQKIQTIRNRYKDALTQERQSLRQAQKELKDLMAGDASTEQVRQKYGQVKTLKQKLGDTRFNSLLEVREVLNLEQRQKFAQRMKHHKGDFHERGSNRQDQTL